MSAVELPNINIDKSSPDEGIKQLLKIVKPDWNSNNIQYESLTGGYCSKIYKCFDKTNSKNAVTVRIRDLPENPGFKYLTNDMEIKTIKLLAQIGHFPHLYAVFANGYCYEFAKGQSMANIKNKTACISEHMLREVIKEMCFVHQMKLENVENEENILHQAKKWFHSNPIALQHPLAPSKEALFNELDILANYFKSLNIPVGLCHGDLHFGNFVWDPATEKVTFLDWEGTNVGYKYHDIAHFLQSQQLFYHLKTDQDSNITIPDDIENKIIQYYFDEMCKSDPTLTADAFEDYKDKINKFQLGPMIIYLAIVLFNPSFIGGIVEDRNKWFKITYDKYVALREKIFGTKPFVVEEKSL